MRRTSPPAPLRDGGGSFAQTGRHAPPSPGGRGAGGEGFSRGPGMTARARVLRAAMTDAERALWQDIRRDRLGVRFRRQIPVLKRFVLDFYAPSVRLAVELDGGHHACEPRDAARTSILNAHGISVLRFWNNDVLRDRAAVIQAICEVVAALGTASPPAPLPVGGGSARGEVGLLRRRFAHLDVVFVAGL